MPAASGLSPLAKRRESSLSKQLLQDTSSSASRPRSTLPDARTRSDNPRAGWQQALKSSARRGGAPRSLQNRPHAHRPARLLPALRSARAWVRPPYSARLGRGDNRRREWRPARTRWPTCISGAFVRGLQQTCAGRRVSSAEVSPVSPPDPETPALGRLQVFTIRRKILSHLSLLNR